MRELYKKFRAKYRWLRPTNFADYMCIICMVWMFVNVVLSILEGTWPTALLSICFVGMMALVYYLMKRLVLYTSYIRYLNRQIDFIRSHTIEKPSFKIGDIVCVKFDDKRHEVTGIRFEYSSHDQGWQYQLDGDVWYMGYLERWKQM